FEDTAGNLWVGTMTAGLRRFRDGKLTAYAKKDGLAHDQINAIYEDRKGSIWIGTLGGLNHFKDGVFITYTAKDGLSVPDALSLHEDQAGTLWIGTYGGGVVRDRDGGV